MKFTWNQNKPIVTSAPMHGITNSAQRQIFKKFGADLVFTEMISSIGLKYENRKTKAKAFFLKKEKPIIVQIFGHTTEETILSAQYAQKMGADGVDFNCGCPARNMIASGNGGRLLLDPDLLINVLSQIKLNIDIPLSLKTRIGYDTILPPNFYHKIATKSNIDCLIIHGRTVKQKYRGFADWEQIKKISQKLSIPVIGSGDITDPYIALDRATNFTPAGIMIGRGALGNPWIFDQTDKLLTGKNIRPRFNLNKIKNTVLMHAKLLIKEFNTNEYYITKFNKKEIEMHAICNMRKHFGWYFKGFPNSKAIRLDLLKIQNLKQLTSYLKNLSIIN